MPEVQSEWTLYLIRCRDKSLYCGITTNIKRRFKEHQDGGVKAARYLRGRGPLQLVYHSPAGTRSHALRLEYRVKQLTRPLKEKLVSGQLQLTSLMKPG